MSGFPPAPDLSVPATAAALAILSGLFVLRVAGQLLVAFRQPCRLPPMDQWYSGVLAYRWLLATQIAIVIAMVAVIAGLLANAPWAVGPYPALGSALVLVAYVYAGAMAVRYVVRMARHPDQRWLGGCIPIVFHVVLAGWILVIAGLWRGT